MTDFTYNQVIEYIDGTRDLNFEAAQKWAREHGTSFEEDVAKREPYEQEHEETYMNPETNETEVKLVKSPTIKRFFDIGDEPKPYVPPEPTDEELQSRARQVRNAYMESTQNRIDRYRNQKELGIETTDTEEVFKQLLEYTQYLRDYPSGENWWESKPLKFDEWNKPKEPDPSETQEEAGI